MNEVWKTVSGFQLEVSNQGNIRFAGVALEKRFIRGKRSRQYEYLYLGKKRLLVHRMVARAFHGEPPTESHECMHLNNNPRDNRSVNLQWGTHEENMRMDRGNNHSFKGDENKNHKLSVEDILYIRDKFKPKCRANGGRALAKKFKVTAMTIYRIVYKKDGGWNHV